MKKVAFRDKHGSTIKKTSGKMRPFILSGATSSKLPNDTTGLFKLSEEFRSPDPQNLSTIIPTIDSNEEM